MFRLRGCSAEKHLVVAVRHLREIKGGRRVQKGGGGGVRTGVAAQGVVVAAAARLGSATSRAAPPLQGCKIANGLRLIAIERKRSSVRGICDLIIQAWGGGAARKGAGQAGGGAGESARQGGAGHGCPRSRCSHQSLIIGWQTVIPCV